MFDFARARTQMVDSQLRTSDVTSHRLLAAFLEIPREAFVNGGMATLAYRDDEITVSVSGAARPCNMTEPRVLARMIQALGVRETGAVLVVGAGTGYSAAILSRICDSVIALESDAALAGRATEILDGIGVTNVVVVEGDLPAGLPDQAPFDAILIDGAVEEVPDALVRQLAPDGRLSAIVGRAPYGKAMLYRHEGAHISSRVLMDANAPLLPGFEREVQFVF
ncbi:MAG: protein-L-isoaspartate O-methyltransferase [Rhodobiaceae bacterium]|nr:protein-L-isoaspartate O-methyltransferase [Rhodobiaceae bacterium]